MKPQLDKLLSSKSFLYFLQLVETMNYTQAAQRIGISQPALTQQIKKLENNVGAELFYSVGKKLYLTNAGKIMQKTIEEIYDSLLIATESIQQDTNEVSGKITLGISASIEDKVFTDFIVNYFKKYPSVEITILMVNRKEVWNSLETGKIDLAVLYVPEQLIDNWRAYATKSILKDEILFLHHNPDFIGKTEISYSETLKQPWVTYPKAYFVSQVILNAFKRKQLPVPESVAYFTKPAQMFKFSNETGTYTALPKSFFQAHECEGNLSAIPFNPPLEMDLTFVLRKEKEKIPRIKHFLEMFDHYLEDEDYISRLKK